MDRDFEKMLAVVKRGNEDDMQEFAKFANWYAATVTEELCKPHKDISRLIELYENSAYLCADLKQYKNITVDWNYLYAYMHAYEKMTDQQIEAMVADQNFSKVVTADNKIIAIINLIGEKGFVCQDDMAKALGVDKSVISKLLNREGVKSLNLFSVRKYGHKNYYFLGWLGKQYYDKYSKENVVIHNNKEDLQKKDLTRKQAKQIELLNKKLNQQCEANQRLSKELEKLKKLTKTNPDVERPDSDTKPTGETSAAMEADEVRLTVQDAFGLLAKIIVCGQQLTFKEENYAIDDRNTNNKQPINKLLPAL